MNLAEKSRVFLKYVLPKPKRVLNLLQLYFAKSFKLTRVLGKPVTAMIEPTNYCNLKCPLCPTGMGLIKRKSENLSLKDFKKIIDNLEGSVFHLRLWNWGEPLLNKDLSRMIKYAKTKRMFVNTSTNSFFLNETIINDLIKSGLDQLIISLDGASQETYSKYRKKGNFNKIVSALKKASELKKNHSTKYPEIKIQFIVMKHNEHEINKVIKLAKEVKADTLFFKTVGIMDPKLKKEIRKYLPKTAKFRRNMLKENEFKLAELDGKVCDYLWEEVTVNVDGSVVPCCRDVHGKYVFGNLKDQKLSEIWNNKHVVNFRKRILRNKNNIDICRFCSGSNKDFFIEEIKLHN